MAIDPNLLAEIQARRAAAEPGRNTLAVSSAIRRMGIKGGTLPLIPQANWDPVVVMGQLNNLTSEPFEARGLLGFRVPAPGAGDAPVMQLSAIGGGGMVIEILRTSDESGGLVVMNIQTVPFLIGVVFTAPILEIGGLPTKARGSFQFVTGPVPPAGSIFLQPGAPLLNIRAVVPGGSHVVIFPGSLNTPLAVEIVFRELEDAPGGP